MAETKDRREAGEGRGTHKSEKILRPSISVARIGKDGYCEGPGKKSNEALNAVDNIFDTLEMLGWELHCCSWVHPRLRRGITRLWENSFEMWRERFVIDTTIWWPCK